MTFLSNKERDEILDAIERVNGEEAVREAITHMDIIRRGSKSHEEYIVGRDNFLKRYKYLVKKEETPLKLTIVERINIWINKTFK